MDSSSARSFQIAVVPVNGAPDCAAAGSSLSELWPPNNQMVGVRILGMTDVADDMHGGQTHAPVRVSVPHSQGKGAAVDDGQRCDSATGEVVTVPVAGPVRLAIDNVLGQQVNVLVDQSQLVGRIAATWSGRDASGREVSPGICLFRLEAAAQALSGRMLVLR